MLAANRTERVTGRMRFLTSSIITMKGIKAAGVLIGTRWVKKFIVLLVVENKMKPSQKGRARDKVTAR